MKMSYEEREVTAKAFVYVLELTGEERIKLIQHLRRSDNYTRTVYLDGQYVAPTWYDALGVAR